MNSVAPDPRLNERLSGVLLGTAVGDAVGLPAEGLSPERIRRRWPGPLRMRLVFGRGMVSDDTEHTLMVAQALLSHPMDPAAFQHSLGWKLRWWFAALPAGVGLATAKACLRLWLGFPANKAGVVSAGSGPAMRSAILGAYFAGAPNKRREFVLASSRLTHRGWQAETAALAVAESAALATTSNGFPEATHVFEAIRCLSDQREWQDRVVQMESCLKAGDTVSDFVQKLGLTSGVTGYSLHVAPVALYAWLRHRADFRPALSAAIQCGGDTDTVGAILGALCGAVTGTAGIPSEWVGGLWEWPRSRRFMEALGKRLAEQERSQAALGPLRYFWPGLVPRNLLFLAAVLTHGVKRLLPPVPFN
jgi:ADP-ribosyl-[dinitrogen reductase] hydrolase